MIQSAADILGKVHKWGCGGGCILYIIFDLVLESPPTSLYTGSAGTPILASNTRSKLIYKLRPPPPTKKGGFCLPAHAWCLLVSSA